MPAARHAVVMAARARSPELRIIVRASTWNGARHLREAGANHVVRPELEGGIEIVRRTLLDLELPVDDVARYVELIRKEELYTTQRPERTNPQTVIPARSAKSSARLDGPPTAAITATRPATAFATMST